MPHVIILGTCDTKINEVLFLRAAIIASAGGRSECQISILDVGRTPMNHEHITVSQWELASKYHVGGQQKVFQLPRGEVIKYMTMCCTNWLKKTYPEGKGIHGIVCAGGTGNTAIASAVMRNALPIGFPKLIVSTAASGDTSPIVGEADITLMYSVVDISGENSLLWRILSNAAGAIGGMATSYEKSLDLDAQIVAESKKALKVGLTMFGVTTPCVDFARTLLQEKYDAECFVFHCTGHGGKSMEQLVRQGELDAVIDFTTTELADYICGGVMSAGPDRLQAPLQAGIPYIISVGACDMVNFGPKNTVPERYRSRNLFEHNPTVTLMRTTAEECRRIGAFIVSAIKRQAKDTSKVRVILPTKGVSMLSVEGQPFYDKAADIDLVARIRDFLKGDGVEVVTMDRNINEKEFAEEAVRMLMEVVDKR